MRLLRALLAALLWLCWAVGLIIGLIVLLAVMAWLALAAGYAAGRRREGDHGAV